MTPPAGLVQPTANPPSPAPARSSSPGIGWLRWLLIGGGGLAAIVVIALIVSGLSLTGALGPVTSADGVFSVRVPKGWVQGHAAAVTSVKPVLALARLEQTNGVESHFVVADTGQFFSLAKLETAWQSFVEGAKFPIAGTLGSIRRTEVAGTSAWTVDFHGSKYAGQLLFVDYGSKTYIVEMSSEPSEFARLRDSDFAAILSSWEWH